MPNAAATEGLSSTLILARRNLPAYSSASFSRTGPKTRQGPHQGAQKSTSTGTSCERCKTVVSKSSSPTSMVHSFIDNAPSTLNRLNPQDALLMASLQLFKPLVFRSMALLG